MAKKYFNVDLETSGEVKCDTLDATSIEGPVNFVGEVTGTTTFQPDIGFTIPDRLTATDLLYQRPAVFSHKEAVTGTIHKQIYKMDTIPAISHISLGTPESFAAYSYANIALTATYDSDPSGNADTFFDPAIELKVVSRSSDSTVVPSAISLTNEDAVNGNTTTLDVRSNKVRVGGALDITGACTADSFTPFSGKHIYSADSTLSVGSAVILEEGVLKLSSSSNSALCVGIVARYFDTAPTEEEQLSSLRQALTTGYAHVISVGDSRVSSCQGFNVCNENGDIQPGDLLVTSSTPGYLMKQDDDIIRSKTVGKVMEAVTFDANGQATGVYGFIYCG